jgi:hypothetical protein
MYGFDALPIAKNAGINRYAKLFSSLFLHITDYKSNRKIKLRNITHLLNNHHEHHKLYFKLQNQKHKDHRDSYDLFFPLPTKASRFLYFSTFLKILVSYEDAMTCSLAVLKLNFFQLT